MRQIPLEEYQSRVNRRHNGNFRLVPIGDYRGARTKVQVYCDKHGYAKECSILHLAYEQADCVPCRKCLYD